MELYLYLWIIPWNKEQGSSIRGVESPHQQTALNCYIINPTAVMKPIHRFSCFSRSIMNLSIERVNCSYNKHSKFILAITTYILISNGLNPFILLLLSLYNNTLFRGFQIENSYSKLELFINVDSHHQDDWS